MTRRYRLLLERLRWAVLALAVVLVVVFLVAQQQSADVTYGDSPGIASIPEGSAGELTGAALPPVDQLTAMVAANPVVRLPGAIAHWDQARVAAAIGDTDVRILVAPPGLTKDQQDQLRDVDNATLRIVGTEVSGGFYKSVADRSVEWRDEFARNDVTDLVVGLIEALAHKPESGDDAVANTAWREPTDGELAPIADALRTSGHYFAPGSTLTAIPTGASTDAFGTGSALYVALPAAPADAPAPDYGPTLAKLFPDRPLVVMYGAWIEYHGPHAADFAQLATATFYSRFAGRLSAYAYPQDNILGAWLGQVTVVRYAGLFDRPLPYQPFDPVRVALPALPWIFGACVLAFLALSARGLLRPAQDRKAVPAFVGGGVAARLAGLTALAVEVSALTNDHTNPALTRGIAKLRDAQAGLASGLPDRLIRRMLTEAEAELDKVGRNVPFPGYRPAEYLPGRLA
jgi:hypothetical protein